MSVPPDDREMTIFEHLAELRQRLIISGISVFVGAAAGWFLTPRFIELLTEPAGIKLQALEPTETFTVYIKIAFTLGLAIAMPVIIWQVLLFVMPALHKHEQRYLLFAVPGVTLSFCIGLIFGFFVVIPAAVHFLGTFGGDVVENRWSIARYMTFVTTFLFWVGLSFETPLFIVTLVKLGVVKLATLTRYRRHALIGSFIIGAVITPTPDPLNQTIVSLPIYLLFELGLLLSRLVR